MHVFFITEWFPTADHPYNGIFVMEHAQAVSLRHSVSLLHIQGVDPTLSQAVQIAAQPVNHSLTIYHLSYRRPVIPYVAWLRQLDGAWQVLRRVANQFGPVDIIHGNVSNTADSSVVLGRLARIPVVLSEHSSAYARRLMTPWQVRRVRFFMNRVDVIMPVCTSLGRYIRDYGIHRPLVPVQNVVNTELFYPSASGKQIAADRLELAMVARLSSEKAVHLAIQACAALHYQGIDVSLSIAGDGPERNRLETLAAELGIAGWVHFHGYQPKSEVAITLRQAKAFLLTSLWETQPVALLEALACGLPVLAPEVGGIPEVITPECGLLFKPGDLSDLTGKLGQLILRLPDYDSQAIHQYALDHFSPQVVSGRFDEIYQRVKLNRHAFEAPAGGDAYA